MLPLVLAVTLSVTISPHTSPVTFPATSPKNLATHFLYRTLVIAPPPLRVISILKTFWVLTAILSKLLLPRPTTLIVFINTKSLSNNSIIAPSLLSISSKSTWSTSTLQSKSNRILPPSLLAHGSDGEGGSFEIIKIIPSAVLFSPASPRAPPAPIPGPPKSSCGVPKSVSFICGSVESNIIKGPSVVPVSIKDNVILSSSLKLVVPTKNSSKSAQNSIFVKILFAQILPSTSTSPLIVISLFSSLGKIKLVRIFAHTVLATIVFATKSSTLPVSMSKSPIILPWTTKSPQTVASCV